MTNVQIIFLICLFSAHILGDFSFQSKSIAQNKKLLWVQILHAFILAILSYLICGVWENWLIPLVIFISHFIIDYAKTLLTTSIDKKSKNKNSAKLTLKDSNSPIDPAWLFLSDQILHFSILLILAIWILPTYSNSFFWISLFGKTFLGVLILITGFVIVVICNSYIIGLIMVPFQVERKKNKGYPNGGRVIGFLERSIIFLLLVFGEPAGIGFLIAAKTLFRLGEIQKANNRKEAEYILIGTLLSFALGISFTGLTLILSANLGGMQYKLLK